MKNYTAIILKENQTNTEVVNVLANNLDEAKKEFTKLGKLICYGVGSKIYYN